MDISRNDRLLLQALARKLHDTTESRPREALLKNADMILDYVLEADRLGAA